MQIPGTVRVHRQLRQFLQDAHAGILPRHTGVDAHLAPNHEDGSSLMTFGTPASGEGPGVRGGVLLVVREIGRVRRGRGRRADALSQVRGTIPGVDGREETPNRAKRYLARGRERRVGRTVAAEKLLCRVRAPFSISWQSTAADFAAVSRTIVVESEPGVSRRARAANLLLEFAPFGAEDVVAPRRRFPYPSRPPREPRRPSPAVAAGRRPSLARR